MEWSEWNGMDCKGGAVGDSYWYGTLMETQSEGARGGPLVSSPLIPLRGGSEGGPGCTFVIGLGVVLDNDDWRIRFRLCDYSTLRTEN
jgi:hypothetical protein